MKRALPLVLALVTALPAPAPACGWWGENLEEKSTGAEIVEGRANGPDLSTPEGMAEMARAYRTGDGVPQDDLVARRWAGLAARAGHVGAMNDFGQMLEQGIGGPKDPAEAAAWYEKAAQAGNPQAAHSLAHMYFDGRGVAADTKKGAALMRRSAAAGHASAAGELARMLWAGELAAQEPGEGCLWWLVADLASPAGGAAVCRDNDPGLSDDRIAELQRRAAATAGTAVVADPGS